jgi:hypothetical protein
MWSLFSSNRVCSDPFRYVEFCTSSTHLIHLTRFCSVNLSRLYHACRHKTTWTVSRLTTWRLPIIAYIMATRFPLHKFIFFLQLIFVLYSNHMCYTFSIMLLSLNNGSLAKQMLCISQAKRRPFLLISNHCRDTPSCVKYVVVLFVLFIWNHSFHHHTVQDRK